MKTKSVILSLMVAAFPLMGAGSSEALKAAQLVEDAFAEVVDTAKPAVVVITNKQSSKAQMGNMPNMPDEFFEFFNIPRQRPRQQRGQRGPGAPQVVGRGSGFIVSPDGYIVTNNHVIKDSEYLEVRTSDGRVYDNQSDKDAVKIIGVDEESDLAVLKLNVPKGKELPKLEFANSDALRVGQWAIAIGAPFNLDYTVTVGCISQKGRSEMGMSTFDSYIQTDASINPGNSGGPLLNIHGQVIGVNQFIVTGGAGSQGSVGIGFAIASNLAQQITDALIRDGEVVRPFLGITMQDLSRDMKDDMNLEGGVLVSDVIAGQAAVKAGIKVGDVILAVNGRKVATSHELLMAVTTYKPGDKIELNVRRGEKDLKITVKAGRRDDYLGKGHRNSSDNVPGSLGEQLGIQVQENDGKVIIADIIPNGATDRANSNTDDKLREGDVILEFNRTPVKSIADLQKALQNNKKNTVYLYVGRTLQSGEEYRFFIGIPLKK